MDEETLNFIIALVFVMAAIAPFFITFVKLIEKLWPTNVFRELSIVLSKLSRILELKADELRNNIRKDEQQNGDANGKK